MHKLEEPFFSFWHGKDIEINIVLNQRANEHFEDHQYSHLKAAICQQAQEKWKEANSRA